MNRNINILLAGILQVLIMHVAFTQEAIQPAKLYQGGDQFMAPTYGIRMTMPPGWSGMIAGETTVYTIQCDTLGDVLVYIFPTEQDLDTRLKNWENGIPIRPGVTITLTEKPELDQGRLTGRFSTATNKSLKVVGVAKDGPYDIGYSMFLSYQQELNADFVSIANEIADHIDFQEPLAADNVSWSNLLPGKYLYSFEQNTGSSRTNQLWLCPDGTFISNSKARGLYKDLGKEYKGKREGTYEVAGTGKSGTLTLNFKKAAPFQVQLDFKDDKLYLNGNLFFMNDHNECD